jgi:uncharacterized protein YegP (UPF0339 family)
MAAKFELYKDKAGEFRWRLVHQNGNIIADSGEGYKNKAGAMNGIESVKENCGAAPIKEIESKAAPKAKKAAPAPKAAAPAPEPAAAAPPPAATPKTVRYSPGMGVESGGDPVATAVAFAVAAWFVVSAGIILVCGVT